MHTNPLPTSSKTSTTIFHDWLEWGSSSSGDDGMARRSWKIKEKELNQEECLWKEIKKQGTTDPIQIHWTDMKLCNYRETNSNENQP